MRNAGVSFENHICCYADHGFSLGSYEMLGEDASVRNSVRVADWFPASLRRFRQKWQRL